MNIPLKRSKNHRRLRRPTHAPSTPPPTKKHSRSNKARKPKQHRHRFHPQDGKLVVRARLGEVPGHDDEVGGGQQRPDGVEDEEVERAGARGVPVVPPPGDDWKGVSSRGVECVCRERKTDRMLRGRGR